MFLLHYFCVGSREPLVWNNDLCQIGEVPNNKTSKNTVVSYWQPVNSSVGMYIYTPKRMNVSNWKGTILKGNNISRSSTWSSRLLDVLKTRRRLAHFSKGLRVHRFYLFESNKDPKQEHRVRTAEVTTNFNYAILRSQIPAVLDLVDPEYLHQWQVASWCGVNSNAPFAHKVLELSWLWLCIKASKWSLTSHRHLLARIILPQTPDVDETKPGFSTNNTSAICCDNNLKLVVKDKKLGWVAAGDSKQLEKSHWNKLNDCYQ